MKKIYIIFILLSFIRINALENITIDNNSLIPNFDKNIYVYNYFTNKDEVNIVVNKKDNENVIGDGIITLNDNKTSVIVSSNNKEYKINIFKNYNKNNREETYVRNIIIKGYELNYDKNIHEYDIYIDNESNLDILCELSNIDDYYSIEGNGNFNKSDNLIKIKTDKDEYIIHAHKTINVSYVEEDKIVEMSSTKKEIVKILIITISCILIVCFYYITFKNKTILNI